MRRNPGIVWLLLVTALLLGAPVVLGAEEPRARDLGVPFEGKPGPNNAITDVAGVEVGHVTLVSGSGELVVGEGPVRTGVTAILPRGKRYEPVMAGWYSLNGNGEMTGTTWIEESGFLGGPVMITNTHSVGVVRDAVIQWLLSEPVSAPILWSLPVVAETWDGFLNDINGFHVKPEHAIEALNNAASGPVAEGNVGGGAGMICHQFKGGIGTASRVVEIGGRTYTLGVLVQANYGRRETLTISGVPVGREIIDLMPQREANGDGSIIVVVATDAPLLPHQLKRLTRRVPIGIGRVGGEGTNGSGDIFVAFSNANVEAGDETLTSVEMLANSAMNPLIRATIQAVEESIINALVAAETMEGINRRKVFALPHDRLREVLRKYNRLQE